MRAMDANTTPVRIELLGGPGSATGVLATVLDLLNTVQALASMRQPVAGPVMHWRCVGPDGARADPGLAVRSWPLLPRPGFSGRPDLVVLPGWHVYSGPALDERVGAYGAVGPRLRDVHARSGQLVGIGNGVAMLAAVGLLDGREAVAPWAFVPLAARHAPDARWQPDRPWVGSDRVWTCDSPVLATELVLQALGCTPVADLAATAADALLHRPDRQQVAAGLVSEPTPRRVPAGAVERARRWLEAHPAAPYDVTALAAEAATSPRTLLRHFELAHGQSPHAYQRGLRLARARVLLETTYLTVEQVAQACGYGDVGTFRRLFRAESGVLPADWREQHRLRTNHRRWSGPLTPT
jgi:transcriptional regulator GlxA family with amidase domain